MDYPKIRNTVNNRDERVFDNNIDTLITFIC